MKRLFAFFKKWELPFIIVIVITTTILGYFAFRSENISRSESFYKTLQLFSLKTSDSRDHCIAYEIARWLAAFIFLFAIVKIVFIFLKESFDGLAIRTFKKHIVICGLSWKVKGIIEEMKKDHKIVIIEKNKSCEGLSDYAFIKNIKILIGDAEDDEVLKKGNICKAKYAFIFSENDESNLRIADSIHNIYEKIDSKKSILKWIKTYFDKTFNVTLSFINIDVKEPIKVRIHLREYNNLMVFKEFHKVLDRKIDYHAFNIYQQAAEKVIDEFSPDQYLPIEDKKTDQVHILVSGLTIQGEYVISQAAHLYHFANLKKLKISIIDSDLKSKLSNFQLRYPNISKVVDLISIDSNEFAQLSKFKSQLANVSVCFICHNEDSESISMYIRLRQFFYGIKNGLEDPKIVTILPQNTSITALFPGLSDNAKSLKVTIKNLYDDFCKKNVIIDNKENYDYIAQRIDYIYEEDQEIFKSALEKYSKEKWEKKTDFEKDWNRYPARHFNIKLRTLGIPLSELSNFTEEDYTNKLDTKTKKLLAKMEHRRWCAEKWLTGFIVGESIDNKDREKFIKRKLKCHPDLVPWQDLPRDPITNISEKAKDYYTFKNLIYAARRKVHSNDK